MVTVNPDLWRSLADRLDVAQIIADASQYPKNPEVWTTDDIGRHCERGGAG